VEVYFDGAPPGSAGTRKLGTVKAHFIPRGQTADSAIRRRLGHMGKSAKNWTVVSSDHEVQTTAKVHQAAFVSSENFVKAFRAALISASAKEAEERQMSAGEMDEWLNLFNGKK